MHVEPFFRYDQVTEYEFSTYIEDIKRQLKKDAPEWHIISHKVDNPPRVLYHITQWDYTKGKDQQWPIVIQEFNFAYEEKEEKEKKFYLLNIPPITKKEK